MHMDVSAGVALDCAWDNAHDQMAVGGEHAIQKLAAATYDLILLDMKMPDIDGLEICKTLRRHGSLAAVPIIMVTAKGEESDVVLGDSCFAAAPAATFAVMRSGWISAARLRA